MSFSRKSKLNGPFVSDRDEPVPWMNWLNAFVVPAEIKVKPPLMLGRKWLGELWWSYSPPNLKVWWPNMAVRLLWYWVLCTWRSWGRFVANPKAVKAFVASLNPTLGAQSVTFSMLQSGKAAPPANWKAALE